MWLGRDDLAAWLPAEVSRCDGATFVAAIAMMDGTSQRVLASELSSTMEAFEVEPRIAPPVRAPRRTRARHGQPEICNTGQGSWFTSPRFTEVPTRPGSKRG